MVGHTNMIASNLLNLYTPGEVGEEEHELDEMTGAEPRIPQTKLPEWSLAPNKVKNRLPAYFSPKKCTHFACILLIIIIFIYKY